ncbi:MAG: hypothetical protein E7620_05090 [Ruminococcaceae bacterium]|nr:hypothetical protein [Oscillospiraceae bacterium]
MSHSKKIKRGNSLYINNWNSSAKRFINTCAVCGAQGYSPTIDEDGFIYDPSMKVINFEHRAIRMELQSVLKPLALDELGRCNTCAKVMDKQ